MTVQLACKSIIGGKPKTKPTPKPICRNEFEFVQTVILDCKSGKHKIEI